MVVFCRRVSARSNSPSAASNSDFASSKACSELTLSARRDSRRARRSRALRRRAAAMASAARASASSRRASTCPLFDALAFGNVDGDDLAGDLGGDGRHLGALQRTDGRERAGQIPWLDRHDLDDHGRPTAVSLLLGLFRHSPPKPTPPRARGRERRTNSAKRIATRAYLIIAQCRNCGSTESVACDSGSSDRRRVDSAGRATGAFGSLRLCQRARAAP